MRDGLRGVALALMLSREGEADLSLPTVLLNL
jgi:hypothetical protein